MGGSEAADERHALRGPIDRPALLAIRDIFDSEEPLATPALDDYLNPERLMVTYEDGLCEAETARLDIRWTTRGDYSVHYTDNRGVNLRWDKHPHGGDYGNASGLEHYHPPPEASNDPAKVTASCITQTVDVLVARAVLKLWRVAYHADSLAPLNVGQNPP